MACGAAGSSAVSTRLEVSRGKSSSISPLTRSEMMDPEGKRIRARPLLESEAMIREEELEKAHLEARHFISTTMVFESYSL